MYIEANITVDPSQLTIIRPAKPTKLFAKLAQALTRGMAASQEEETFTAVAILQQLNVVLRSLEINDIVRITKDDVVCFEDTAGKKDDLKDAIAHFVNQASPADVEPIFNTLTLVLQHSQAGVDYLLEVRVKRIHAVGEHPIGLTVTAFPGSLNAKGDDQSVQDRMRRVFASQEKYDSFTAKFHDLVEAFVNDLKESFQQHMKVDDVSTSLTTKIVRPNRRVTRRQDLPTAYRHTDAHGAFTDYHGRDDIFFYAWMWSEMCADNGIHCHDCTLVSESGVDAVAIGSEGVDAGVGEIMNVETPMEQDGSIKTSTPDITASADSGGGWLDSIGDAFSGCGGGDAGGSSCSSCGGGGCGGE